MCLELAARIVPICVALSHPSRGFMVDGGVSAVDVNGADISQCQQFRHNATV